MLMTFFLGLGAGVLAPYAEPKVKDALESVMLADSPMTEKELTLFSLAICLVGAAILAWIFGNGSALALAIGAALGVFGPRLADKIKGRNAPDYDN